MDVGEAQRTDPGGKLYNIFLSHITVSYMEKMHAEGLRV